MAVYTITFDESAKGFTSFHSYTPDWMGSINNEFYSIKDGQLHKHYDETSAVRNTFYGVPYNSTATIVVNEAPEVIKVIEAIETESNKAFDMTIISYLNDEVASITQTTLSTTDFENKEGKFHAYVRRNELTGDYTAKNAYGLGEGSATASTVIQMEVSIPRALISAGDELYDSAELLLGNIVSYDTTLNRITIDASVTVAADTFLFGLKDGRIEGSAIRGYNFEIEMVDATTTRTELFALSSTGFESFPG
jgi:hypothetical protein